MLPFPDNDPARLRLGGFFLSTPQSSSRPSPLADPNMKARLAAMGGAVLPGPPISAKLIAAETEMRAKMVTFSGAKAD
jgi:hypothetical protein